MLAVVAGFCRTQTVQPSTDVGSVSVAERDASSAAKLLLVSDSATLPQLVVDATRAMRSPVPASPENVTRTVPPATNEPVTVTRTGAAVTAPAASVVEGATTKDRSRAALYMSQRAEDAASGAAATGYAAKPADR